MEFEEEKNPFQIGCWLEGDSLAPPCQADLDVVEAIIQLAGLSASSILYDLGCGDGRICLKASETCGCRSVGVEIERVLVDQFQTYITRFGLEERCQAVHGDLLEQDLSEATAVVLYLLPNSVELIKPRLLAALRAGVVVICNTWGLKDLRPQKVVHCGHMLNVTLFRYDAKSLPENEN